MVVASDDSFASLVGRWLGSWHTSEMGKFLKVAEQMEETFFNRGELWGEGEKDARIREFINRIKVLAGESCEIKRFG